MKKFILLLIALCFLVGEMESGWNRICYYDCYGSTRAITISVYEMCPLTL